MDEILGVMCGLTVALAAITVLGHLSWLVLAAILRWLSGTGLAEEREATPCPACGARLWAGAVRCDRCGHPLVPPTTPRIEDDWAATLRHLRRLHERGWIEAAEHDALVALMREAGPEVASLRGVEARPGTPTAAVPSAGEAGADSTDEEIVDAIVLAEAVSPIAPRPAPPPTAPAVPPAALPPVHALDRDYAEQPVAVSAARRQLASVLQTFMAEKNIRWGELLAGLLIVGSAVGLVISLRATLSETIPYFPALIFMGITLAIYGAGMYTLRRWNLRATSRGVLTIALLLTPLNFLAAIIMSGPEDRAVTHPVYLLAVAVGLSAGAWITFSAGRALVQRGWWRLTCGVLAASVGQLLIDRWARPGASLGETSLLAAVPLGGFLLATASQIRGALPWWHLSGRHAQRLFLTLGISLFALAAPLGVLISKDEPLRDSIAQLAPVLSLVAAVILATGLLVHRRLVHPRWAAQRTAGTALAVGGAMLMGAAVVFAWPRPDLLIAVGLTNGVMLVGLALRGNLAILHVAAVSCLALASLVALHLLQGNLVDVGEVSGRQLLDTLLLGRNSVLLTVLALISCGAALGWMRAKRRPEAVSYLAAAAGLAGVGLVVALWAGFGSGGDRNLMSAVFAFYAAAMILAAAYLPLPRGTWERATRQSLCWTGSALLLVMFAHGLAENTAIIQWLSEHLWRPQRPWLAAALLHADLCAALALIFAGRHVAAGSRQHGDARWSALVDPLAWSALAAATLAVPFALWVRQQAFALHAGYLFAAAAVWFAAAVLYRRDLLTAAFHVLATVAIGFLIAAHCRAQSWGASWWADPRHVQYQLAMLASWSAAWSIGRRLTSRQAWSRQLLGPQWLTIQETIVAIGLAGTVVLGLASCAAGVAAELGLDWPLATAAASAAREIAGSWLCVALLLVALLAQLGNRLSTEGVVELLLATAIMPLLAAAHWEAVGASASALRWALAGYTLAAAVAVWLRTPLWQLVRRSPRLGGNPVPSQLTSTVRDVSLGIGGLPIVVLTTIVAARRMAGFTVGQPAAESLLAQLGPTVSYAVPLLVLVAVLVGHAIRDRQPRYLLAGSVLLQYVVCLAYALRISAASPGSLAELLQWNGIALAGYTLIWLALRRWSRWDTGNEARSGDVFCSARWSLEIQLAATVAVLTILAVWAAVGIFLTPGGLSPEVRSLGSISSYVVWVLTAVTAGAVARNWPGERQVLVAGGFALALVAFLAATRDASDALRTWQAYHVLSCGVLAVAAGWTAAAWRWPGVGRAAAALCGLLAVLAVRSSTADPLAPWWPVATAAGATGLTTLLAVTRRSQPLAYGAALLTVLATSLGVIGYFDRFFPGADRVVLVFVQANLIALAAAGLLWLAVDLWYQRRRGAVGLDARFRWAPVQVVASVLAVAIAALFFAGSLAINTISRTVSGRIEIEAANASGIVAVGVLGLLGILSLWETRRGYGLPCLYVWGLVVLAVVLDALGVKSYLAFWSCGVAAGGYATLTGLLWRQGATLASIGHRWGIRDPIAGLQRTAVWLPRVNLLLAAAATLATLVVVSFFPDRWMRVSSGMMPAVLAIGLAALAQRERRTRLEFISLLMTGVAAIGLSWADLPPDWSERLLLLRLIRTLIALAGLTFVYGLIVVQRVPATSHWQVPVRQIALTFGGGAGIVLLAVLLLERWCYVPGVGAPVAMAPMLAVAVVLVGLVIGLLSLALLPKQGFAPLTERQRQACVYGAEIVAALIFAHLFMCRPALFSGLFRPYWPYLIMAVAFAGVGVGELFQRSGIRVLSDPLQRTGAFLPLIPALGFWVVVAEKSDYSVVLFSAGLVYLVLSMLRRSMASGLAALVAGNAALWSLLTDSGFAFWQHPQFWLIPPAVSALAAGQLNRRQLKPAQLAALRYASVLVIYLSSSSEIFLRGVGASLWPPMILATLSVAGVFAGIILQVRAFLYLGTSFVLLSVITMVWHAARAIQHVWPWWAFGIGLGIGILILFGLFEKKRPELTAWMRRLQQWEV
jgi:hypothetical protein